MAKHLVIGAVIGATLTVAACLGIALMDIDMPDWDEGKVL